MRGRLAGQVALISCALPGRGVELMEAQSPLCCRASVPTMPRAGWWVCTAVENLLTSDSDCVMNEKALILLKVAKWHFPNETEHQSSFTAE